MSTSPHTCAHTCQPLHPSQQGLRPNPYSPPATTRAAFASLPSAVMRPKFLTQSHTISRNLSCISRPSLRSLYISEHRTKRQPLQAACGKNPTAIRPVPMHENRDLRRRRRRKSSPSHKLHESQFKQMSTISHTCAHTRQPLHPPQKGHQRGPCAATRLPSCAQNFSHNLTQSLVISRVTLLHLACPSTLSNALKMLLTSIPSETGTLRANETVESWPSRLPFRNTQFSVQPAPSPLQEPGPPYKLYPSPQDQGGSGPSLHLNKRILSDRTTTVARPQRRRTRRDTLRPSAKFLSERAKKHMNSRGNSRHFAPL